MEVRGRMPAPAALFPRGGGIAIGAGCLRAWLEPRVSLDVLEKRKISSNWNKILTPFHIYIYFTVNRCLEMFSEFDTWWYYERACLLGFQVSTHAVKKISHSKWLAIQAELRVVPAIFVAGIAFHFIRGILRLTQEFVKLRETKRALCRTIFF